MNKQLKSLVALNPHERMQLNTYLYMEDWHFEALFLDRCIEMSQFFIRSDGEGHPVYAKVFGLQARYTSTGRSCIANIFIQYEYRVYRVHDICQASDLIALFKKDSTYQALRSKGLKRESARRRTKKVQNKTTRLIGRCG